MGAYLPEAFQSNLPLSTMMPPRVVPWPPFVDAQNLEAVAAAIRPNTKAVYLETLGNPNSDIPDIDAIGGVGQPPVDVSGIRQAKPGGGVGGIPKHIAGGLVDRNRPGIPDIDAIAQIAHAHGLPLVIDNTFATPFPPPGGAGRH